MTPDQFAYWMQGFAELNEGPPTAEQWQAIKDHLQTVFVKVTPQVRGVPNWPHQQLATPFMPLPQVTC